MWYDTTLMIKPHEFLCKKNFLVWYQNSATSCDEEMRNKSKWHSLNVRARIVCPTRGETMKTNFFMSHDDDHCNLSFVFVPRPLECAQVLVHVIMLCLNVSRCTIAPEGDKKKCCNTAKEKAAEHSTATSPFVVVVFVGRWECLHVTWNLNDIFLEVMFSIASENKNCPVIAQCWKRNKSL